MDSQKLDKKQIIIDSAFNLFAERGYAQTSMEDIVKVSGISKGGIYHYFTSKEEIFLEIAKMRMDKRHRADEEGLENISNKERLSKYMNWVLTGYFEEQVQKLSRFAFQFWSMHAKNELIGQKAKERYTIVYGKLSEILENGIRSGEFKEDLDIESMVYIIVSTLDGIGFVNGVMGIPFNENVIKTYKDMILERVCKEG